MTNEQKIDMFRMRLEGATLAKCGKKYGVTRQYVMKIFKSVTSDAMITRKHYIYPAIVTWMKANHCTQKEFAREVGVGQATISTYLTGGHSPTYAFINAVLSKTGMTYEEAFKREASGKPAGD